MHSFMNIQYVASKQETQILDTMEMRDRFLLEDLFRPGELSLTYCDIDRVIVGEVRGAEVVPMFKAMQMGNGSLSTIHANSAEDVIERLVTCAVEDASNSEAFAYRQVGQHIDLILFNEVEVDPVTGKRHRYLSEVIEVGLGEGSGVSVGVLEGCGADVWVGEGEAEGCGVGCSSGAQMRTRTWSG